MKQELRFTIDQKVRNRKTGQVGHIFRASVSPVKTSGTPELVESYEIHGAGLMVGTNVGKIFLKMSDGKTSANWGELDDWEPYLEDT